MDRAEGQALIEVALEAGREQHAMPLLMALAVCVAAISTRDPELGAEMARALREQADSFPVDLQQSAGMFLRRLAALGDRPQPEPGEAPADAARRDLRSALRLIQGGLATPRTTDEP